MRSKQPPPAASTLCLVLVLLGLVSGCGPPPETPRPSLPDVVSGPTGPVLLERFPFFVTDYVIVTGPSAYVEEIIWDIQTEVDVTLNQVDWLELPYVDDLLDRCAVLPQYELASTAEEMGWSADEWVMALYAIRYEPDSADPLRTAQVVAAINHWCLDTEWPCLVSADAVYPTGRHPITGGPYEPAASPYEPAASPYPDDPIKGANYGFWTQWAFGAWDWQTGAGGIDLIRVHDDEDVPTYTRSVTYTGQGVRVGVFDTSPFATPGLQTIGWVTPTLSLNVTHLEPLVELKDLAGPLLDNHGLFVAGLVYAVAPSSTIHLYRVLDEHKRGDLWTLNVALDLFIKETLQVRNTHGFNGAIMNLSLGGRPPHDYYGGGLYSFLEDQARAQGLSDEFISSLNEEVTSLETLIASAYCSNIVVVAAAGNESSMLLQRVLSPQLPASFVGSISVAASNIEGGRACFSNWADVAAPGGDGTGGFCTYPAIPITCVDDHYECGLVSLYKWPEEDAIHYAYWAGTSFSTPLVSGLVALMLEATAGSIGPDEIRTQVTQCPTRPSEWMQFGQYLGEPPCIISVWDTLHEILRRGD